MKSLGEYEPLKASILQKKTTQVNKEPKDTETELCKRPIRFHMSRSGGEVVAQGQTKSYTPVVLRLPLDSKTKLITPKDKVVHNGITYEIVAIPPIPYGDDEIELTCKAVQ